MIIHPNGQAKTTLTKVDKDMEQMHALDVRIDKLYELHGDFALSDEVRVHRQQVDVHPDADGFFNLKPMTMYAFDTIHEVIMAEGEAGFIIPRSTLTRNGLTAGSALYDAGYVGGVNGYIGNISLGKSKIKKGTRVGQFIVVKADTIKLYDGVYQTKTEEKKDVKTVK